MLLDALAHAAGAGLDLGVGLLDEVDLVDCKVDEQEVEADVEELCVGVCGWVGV